MDCLIADPPFNAGKDYGDGFNDSRPLDIYYPWLADCLAEAVRVVRPGGALWVMNDTRHIGQTQGILDNLGANFQNMVCWLYGNPTPNTTRFPKTWRPILFYRKSGTPQTWNIQDTRLLQETLYCNFAHSNGRNLHDVWPDIPKLVGGYLAQAEVMTKSDGSFAHVAQMPLAIAIRAILLTTNQGALVVDPFVGSGTTCVAAQRLGRRGAHEGPYLPVVILGSE